MSLLTLIIVIAAVGILLYVIERHVPMNATVKHILVGVVVLVLVIFLLKTFGVLEAISRVQI